MNMRDSFLVSQCFPHQFFFGFESHSLYFNTMLVANVDGSNFLNAMNEESSCDQDGLNQASVRYVCKTEYFPLLIWMKEQT